MTGEPELSAEIAYLHALAFEAAQNAAEVETGERMPIDLAQAVVGAVLRVLCNRAAAGLKGAKLPPERRQ